MNSLDRSGKITIMIFVMTSVMISVAVGATVPTIMNFQLQEQLHQINEENQKNIEKAKAINANLDSMEQSLLKLQAEISSNNVSEQHHEKSFLGNTTWYFSDQTKIAVAKLKVGECYGQDAVMGNICKVGTYP